MPRGCFSAKSLTPSRRPTLHKPQRMIDDLLLKESLISTHSNKRKPDPKFFLQTSTLDPEQEQNILEDIDTINDSKSFSQYYNSQKDVQFHTRKLTAKLVTTVASPRPKSVMKMKIKTQQTTCKTAFQTNTKTKTTNMQTTNTQPLNGYSDQPRIVLDVIKKEVDEDKIVVIQGGIDEKKVKLQIDPMELKIFYDEISKVHCTIERLADEGGIYLKELIEEADDYLTVKNNKLNQFELEILVEALKQKTELIKANIPITGIDFDALDKLISKLAFFERFTKSTRINLLKLGEYILIEAGQEVFRQGDYGDHLFVILKGSVVVKVERKIAFRGEAMNQVVQSLYDGQHFGELAIMETQQQNEEDMVLEEKLENLEISSLKEAQKVLFRQDMEKLEKQSKLLRNMALQDMQKNKSEQLAWMNKDEEQRHYIMSLLNDDDRGNQADKQSNFQYQKVQKGQLRKATIQAAETCHLLAISKENYKNILMVLMQDELEQKIRMLRSLRFFKHLQPFVLIPLANQLIAHKYSLDEVVVKEGQPLEYMYILYKGSCNAIKITDGKRIKIPTLGKGHLRKTPPFACGPYTYSNYKRQFPTDDDYLKAANEDEDAKYKIREYGLVSSKEDITYKRSYIYKRIYPGDIIFGRVLTQKTLEGESGKDTARMTIVSTSAQTILYKISVQLLQFCPEYLILHLIHQLETLKEVDEIPPQPLNQQIKKYFLKKSNLEKDDQILYQREVQQKKAQYAEYLLKNGLKKPQNSSKQNKRNFVWEQFKEELVIDQLKYK